MKLQAPKRGGSGLKPKRCRNRRNRKPLRDKKLGPAWVLGLEDRSSLETKTPHHVETQSIELMSDMLNRHTIDSPPFRIKILDLEDVKMASQHLVWNFYSWYSHYYHVMAKKRLIVISSSTVKFGNMPMNLSCSEGTQTAQPSPIIVDMYLKTEDELVITKEEMELIMKGESSLNLPPKKRQELIRAKLDADKKERIEKVMARELGILNLEIEEKLREIREENEALMA